MREKIDIPKDFLVKEYLIKEKSMGEICKDLKVGYPPLKRNLIEKGIRVRTDHEQQNIDRKNNKYKIINIPKEILFKEYILNGKSISQLHKELKYNRKTIEKNLIKNGIKIRGYKEQQELDRNNGKYGKIKIDKDFLVKEYIVNEKSMVQIYKEFDIHHSILKRNLIEKGIKVRTDKKQSQLDYDNHRHSNLNLLPKGIEKDPRFFYLLGVFKGDGYYDLKRKRIQINVSEGDLDMLKEVTRIIYELSKIKVSIRKNHDGYGNTQPQWRITFCCLDFFRKGFNKLLPKTKEERINYLKGLFDAEGSISLLNYAGIKEGYNYNSFSKCLSISQSNISDLMLWNCWLGELGFDFNMHIRNDGRSQLITKKNDNIILFNELIKFRIKRKQDKLDLVLSKLSSPILNEEQIRKIRQIYLETNFGSQLIGKIFNRSKYCILNLLKKSGINTKKDLEKKISIEDIERVESILGRKLDIKIPIGRLKRYKSNSLSHVKIKSIKLVGEFETGDIQTTNYHNFFLSNGILSHNSTLAIQVAQYLAWRIAGGEVISDENGKAIKIIQPKEKVRFNLDHVVFFPNELVDKAKKFPPNSVFVYDEGRMGLDSKRAMESINKGMEDFFQECGQYNHVILIVLPDFFKLAYDYAITRSMFLLNVGVSKQWHRGRFEFYNRNQKEWLYVLGKRRISSYGKYSSTNSSFFGKFTSWLPFDKDEYNQRKKAALEKKDLTRFQKRFKLQRDASFYIIKNKTILTDKEIAKDMSNICGFEISEDVIEKGILEIKRSIEK